MRVTTTLVDALVGSVAVAVAVVFAVAAAVVLGVLQKLTNFIKTSNSHARSSLKTLYRIRLGFILQQRFTTTDQ